MMQDKAILIEKNSADCISVERKLHITDQVSRDAFFRLFFSAVPEDNGADIFFDTEKLEKMGFELTDRG